MRTGTCGVDDLEAGVVDDAGLDVVGTAVDDGLLRCAGFSRSREMFCR